VAVTLYESLHVSPLTLYVVKILLIIMYATLPSVSAKPRANFCAVVLRKRDDDSEMLLAYSSTLFFPRF
jgi:hypothetical protein